MTEHSEHDTTTDAALPEPERQYTVEEVLDMARRTVRTASVCLRGDLQGEYDALLSELSTLITPAGELIGGDPETAVGEVSPRARVEQIAERITAVRRTMAAHMWRVQFEAMAADEWDSFVKRHKPNAGASAADTKAYYDRIMAETAISPTLSIAQIQKLRVTLSASALIEMSTKALEANGARAGIDVPKLPSSLQMRADLSSEG